MPFVESAARHSFLIGGGEMGERIRARDWTTTPFGPPESWSPALRTSLSLCLNSDMPTAIYWGRDLRLLYNDAWAPIAGEKHPWALGRAAREVWADIWDVIEPQLEEVMRTGRAFSIADQMLPMERGGRVQRTHWDYSFAPILDVETGEVLGIFNQGNETTARLSAERALRASEERLEYALGASDTIGTWDWDVPADVITADARFARLYGVDPDRARSGAPIQEFFAAIHPEDRPSVEAAIGEAMRSGAAFVAEYRLLQPDGSARWVAAEGRCTLAPDGTPLRFPGITFDITERKRAEAALRESEARFRAITDSVDQMIWSTRPDGFHDYFNQRWYDFTGVPEGTTDGEEWNGMFHPEDRDRAWTIWSQCLETGEPYHIEYRLRHRSGQYRWVLGRAQPVRDDAGRITRWFGTCTDIQEIVDAREILARSHEELEREVSERTAALMQAEAQLRQAQKMEAIGQLTGGIAHDFNNMLAVILGGLDLLERRMARGDTDVARYVEAARDGAARAAALTQRLLAFARRQQLQPEVIDVNRMVAGMTELLARTLGEQVRIETALAEGLGRTRADPSQLENVVLNLSVNARDAMPEGGRLRIETASVEVDEAASRDHGIPPGPFVRLAVGDTGSGMDPEVASRAFDPFFTTKAVGKGSGLGLSQVFGFVRQSGGYVEIESEPGRGTTVNVYLPQYEGEEAPPAPKSGATPIRGGAEAETIIVVEDDERVRNYSVEALRELGYTVLQAPDGAAALELVEQGQPVTLLFTDMVMPGMSGRELVARLSARLPDLKVLFTTGYTRAGAAGGEEPAPDEIQLQKPFSIEQLAEKVRGAIDR